MTAVKPTTIRAMTFTRINSKELRLGIIIIIIIIIIGIAAMELGTVTIDLVIAAESIILIGGCPKHKANQTL